MCYRLSNKSALQFWWVTLVRIYNKCITQIDRLLLDYIKVYYSNRYDTECILHIRNYIVCLIKIELRGSSRNKMYSFM